MTLAKYTPPAMPKEGSYYNAADVDLNDPAAVAQALRRQDNAWAVLFHATEKQLGAAAEYVRGVEKAKAKNTAEKLLMAAAEAQGHA